MRKIFVLFSAVVLAALLTGCGSSDKGGGSYKMVVSVKDQRMLLVKKGQPIKTYKVSTSKFGVGSRAGSNRTPLGRLKIARKIGGGAPSGAVFKSRKRTGEVIRPNAPGRDPIVTRILWLSGKESHNRNTYNRLVYIHGTPDERNIGRPVSYGCIRMKSRDVIDLYRRVKVGSEVQITTQRLKDTVEGKKYYLKHR